MRVSKRLFFSLLALAAWPAFADSDPTISGTVPAPVREQLLADFAFLHGLQGQEATPLFREIFAGSFNGGNIARFFNARIKSINTDSCDDNPATVACVIYAVSPNVIWLTESYARFAMPQIFRLSTILHESRHSEYDFRFHARCPVPFLDENGRDIVSKFSGIKLEGQLACDESAAGSYGLQVEFLKNTQLHCTNCSDKVKLDAQIFSNDVLNRITQAEDRQKLRQDLGM